jgi:hypothetical protein
VGGAARAELRVAAFAAPFTRDGPGLLLRDLMAGGDDRTEAALEIIAAARPDILLLAGTDWDAGGVALEALAARLAAHGLDLPHRLAIEPNAGRRTGLDLDGDGAVGPRDAQGYGRFAGQGGMALLSRWPLGAVRDLSGLLWRDLPGARLPVGADGAPFPSEAAQAVQRLSSTGHWVVEVLTPEGPVTLMAWAATPPVFDGPEDRNGLRNADELALWTRLLDGALGPPPAGRFVLLGQANLDPADGQGLRSDMAALLGDPRLIDPRPASDGARLAADPGHRGDPALDTADWQEPGNLRVTYVLPSADWRIAAAGVLWPAPGEPLAEPAALAGPHRLVWVDLAR